MKRNSTRILISLILSLTFMVSHAQKSDEQKSKDFRHRFSVAGNLGFQFGSITGFYISPEVKFRAVDNLYFGVGCTYEFMKYNNYFVNLTTRESLDLQVNVFGGRIFTRYYLASLFENEFLGNIFAHVEYEYLSYYFPYTKSFDGTGTISDGWDLYKEQKQTVGINSILVGGGYKQPVTKSMFLDLLILFNLNDTYNSPYTNPIIRIGFGASL